MNKKLINGFVLAAGLLFSAAIVPNGAEASGPSVNPYAPLVEHDDNNLYDMVTVSILEKNKDLVNEPLMKGNGGMAFNWYSKGLSKVSYDKFIKQLPGYLKNKFINNTWWYLGFSSNIEYKDSKKAIVEIAELTYPGSFANFYDVEYERYTIFNNGKLGVTFTRSRTSFDLLKHNWAVSDKNINYSQIFKDLGEPSIPAPSVQVQKLLKAQKILTVKIIENRVTKKASSIYTSPDTKSKKLGTLKELAGVEIVQLKSGWAKIIYGNSYGWILTGTLL